MKLARAFAIMVFALLTVSVSTPAQAATYTVPGKKSANGVTQYHTTIYSKSTCRGGTVYRFESVSFRYHRKSTRNSALIREFWMKQHGANGCDGRPHVTGAREITKTNKFACFGCRSTSKLWSDQYYYDPNWAYMGKSRPGRAYQGSVLKSTARYVNSAGTVTARSICTEYSMQGRDYC